MTPSSITLLFAMSATLVQSELKAQNSAPPSHILLDLARDKPEQSMSLEQRRAAFPALAGISHRAEVLIATGDLPSIISDWHRYVAPQHEPLSLPFPEITSYALGSSAEGIIQWIYCLKLGRHAFFSPNYLDTWQKIATQDYRDNISATAHERYLDSIPHDFAITSPVYLSMSLDTSDAQASQTRQKITASIILTLRMMGVVHSVERSQKMSIITIDLRETRRTRPSRREMHPLLLGLKNTEKLYITLSQNESLLSLALTPDLDILEYPASYESSILASSKLKGMNGRLEGRSYAFAWVSQHFSERCTPSSHLARIAKDVEVTLETLATHSKDAQSRDRLLQGALALRVNTQALLKLLPNYVTDSSLYLWSDQGLHLEYATGLANPYLPGELSHLHLADAQDTVFFSESTRLPMIATGTGPVKFILNGFHILEGIADTLDMALVPRVNQIWQDLQVKYFPTILQFSSGLRDIGRGLASAGGFHVALREETSSRYDWLAYGYVDDFAPLSSGWSQALSSMMKFYELLHEQTIETPIFTCTIAPNNSINYVLTPPCLSPHYNLYINASKKHVIAASYPHEIEREEELEGSNFTGLAAILRIPHMEKMLERPLWGEDALASYLDTLYAVLVQRDDELYLRATITTRHQEL